MCHDVTTRSPLQLHGMSLSAHSPEAFPKFNVKGQDISKPLTTQWDLGLGFAGFLVFLFEDSWLLGSGVVAC